MEQLLKKLSLVQVFIFIILVSACGDNIRIAPSIPAGLTSTGSLGKISLSWIASSGCSLKGYNIYRSIDGTNYEKITTGLVTATTYDDTIESPDGDGIFYYYKVTGVCSLESDFSDVVKNIHGTRLASSYASGFDSTVDAKSPYVAEGTTVVDGGDLSIWSGAKLYILDNAVIDVEQDNRRFRMFGLIRILASTTSPATITAHKVGGGVPDDGHGLLIMISGCESYNPAGGSGTLLQNAIISNLAGGTVNSNQHLKIIDCSPKLYNLKIYANKTDGDSRLVLDAGGSAIIENCLFNKIYPYVKSDFRATSFKMDHNILRDGKYSIYFKGLSNPGVVANQIELNDFDGTKNAMLDNMTGTFTVPIGNNYWNGGIPSTSKVSSDDVDFDFTTALGASPSGVGPTW